ncbi:unnamed protein product [Rotaria magnacalcarata]|uniref:Uncharacterized protein n=1 Tax=Rotaria magnacalcarata TaxID=392030 RepID=A0A8S3D6T9_9BILA|nr:unnamed protein product [Rotaria magnacalcarata]
MDSWKRTARSYAQSFFNRTRQLLGFEENSLRPELEIMFIELGYSPENAKSKAEQFLKDLQEPDLMAADEVLSIVRSLLDLL